MKKTYITLTGDPHDYDFPEHDISKYDRLFHVTPKSNLASIEEHGLRLKQPQYKSLVETDLLFFSYPISGDTSDLFRFSEQVHAVVVLDAKKLHEAGYQFYDDAFSQQDISSKRNHLAIDRAIPKEFILKTLTFE